MRSINNSEELVSYLEKDNLVGALIDQLNKDFQLANVHCSLDSSINSTELANQLKEIVLGLLENNYDGYLNLIYRIDIPLKDLEMAQKLPFNERINKVVFLVLKREFQKVWLRMNYKG